MNVDRHKVFISFYSGDKYYKDYLINHLNYYYNIFDDYSVGDGDIDDTYLTDEDIRIKIRDEFIKDATVLVLLCGKNTKARKFIDWELHAAMYNTEKNPRMGIVVINLPESSNGLRAASQEEKDIIKPFSTNWYHLVSRSEYEELFPDMPDRIISCFVEKDSPISVVNWNVIAANPENLATLIDIAYKRRKTIEYSLKDPLRSRNSRIRY